MIKKYKFLFILLFGLFVFLPKDTFASTDITVNTYEFFWDAISPDGSSEIWRGNLLPMQRLRWGDAYSNEYNLIRIAPLLHYNALSGDSTYNATLNFYVETIYPYDYEDVHCSLYSDNNTVSSCSVDFVNETQIDSTKSLMFFKVSYQWTTTANYVEFWLNFDNFRMSPVNTYFFYNILDFKGNVDKNQIIIDGLGETNKKLDDLKESQDKTNDLLEDDDVSGAEDSASGFFNDFESDDFGLSSIITMPLQFIEGLSSSTCYSLNLPLPFVDTNVTLPCMTSIYQRYFGDFLALYQIITTGFIAYGVCINIFRLVQGFKNPDNDNVEVMEL